ncbi:MAG: hypothetical protein PVJ67_04920 [Candidatus Pacearchaeota archaeon]|jgi:hypothetical protein
MAKKESILDEILKAGLILGSIWLGAEFLKSLSEDKEEGGDYGAGTQPPV